MAKVSEVNPNASHKQQRRLDVLRNALESSAIEGIKLTAEAVDPKPDRGFDETETEAQ